jgi:hypothetical protein
MTSPAKKAKQAVAAATVSEATPATIGHNSGEAVAKPELTLLFKKTELITGEKAILSLISTVFETVVDAQRKIQLAALSAVEHSLKHGDITIIEKMLNTIPEGMRKDSLAAYFDKYACVNFVQDEETKKYKPVYSREKRDNMMKNGWYDAAATNWWYKATKVTEYVPFELSQLQANLEKMLGQAAKKAAKDAPDDFAIKQALALLTGVNAQIKLLLNSEAVLEQQAADTIIAA